MAPSFLLPLLLLPLTLTFVSADLLHSFAQQPQEGTAIRAGVAKVDGTLPVGVPLAGYNHDARRVPHWPLPQPRKYTTFMMPSVGVLDPTWNKALVLDNGSERIAIVTLDGVGSDGALSELAWKKAHQLGFTVPFEKTIFSASHSHSGPGAITKERLWELAPATDLFVPELQDQMATTLALALTQAEANLQPAALGIGMSTLTGVTSNRRAGDSPYVHADTIDPNLGVFRVDDLEGKPIATLWNFAIHGVCYGPGNMKASSDIMGKTCEHIEQLVGGVAIFVNSDAGDVSPGPGVCDNAPDFKGAPVIAEAVKKARDALTTHTNGLEVHTASAVVDFGKTNLNLTTERLGMCENDKDKDSVICQICKVIPCKLNLHLGSDWVETHGRYTALRLRLGGEENLVVTMPGEPLVELGWEVRNDTQPMGFTRTFIFGYANNHLGYFATPREYDVGGYESQLSFWGYNTAEMVRAAVKKVAAQVKP